jgi:hypothetical protein
MAWPEPGSTLPAPGSIALDDPRNDAWRGLLPRAAALIGAAGPLPRLTLGGGSMLAWRYGHRDSRDLDFFLPDAQLLGMLSPRLNDAVAALAENCEEASNFLRFTFGDQEVDFIVGAPVLLRGPTRSLTLAAGLVVPIEPPGEIIAKKMLYRAAGFTHRDVIDLALVAALEPGELDDLPARLGPSALTLLLRRLGAIEAAFAATARARIALRPGFEGLVADAVPLARAAVSRMQAALSRRAPR